MSNLPARSFLKHKKQENLYLQRKKNHGQSLGQGETFVLITSTISTRLSVDWVTLEEHTECTLTSIDCMHFLEPFWRWSLSPKNAKIYCIFFRHVLDVFCSIINFLVLNWLWNSEIFQVAVLYFHDEFTLLKGLGLLTIIFGVTLFNWYK